MNKKGFTLTELIAVIIILALVALIAVPVFMRVIEENREKALQQQIKNLKEIANTWVVAHDGEIGYGGNKFMLTFEQLKRDGYIKPDDIMNPVTDEPLKGYFFVHFDSASSIFVIEYTEEQLGDGVGYKLLNYHAGFNIK